MQIASQPNEGGAKFKMIAAFASVLWDSNKQGHEFLQTVYYKLVL
jgi:hypothetical protein